MVRTVTATEARVHFGEVTRRVEEHGEAVVVERDGREVVAIISIDDYRRLNALGETDQDWWQLMQANHTRILEELGDRELTPADELIHQLREERDAELLDLS